MFITRGSRMAPRRNHAASRRLQASSITECTMDSTVANAAYGANSFLWFCIFAFGVLLSILWILVPFAVFGIKGLLRRIARSLEAIEKQNVDLLAAWREAPRDYGRPAESVVYRDVRADGTVVREERVVPPPR